MTTLRWASLGLCAVFLWGGCTEKSDSAIGVSRQSVAHLVGKKAPSPQHALDFAFEDKLRLIGYDVDKDVVPKSGSFRVTWYWKVEKALTPGWRQFTHMADAKDVNRVNLDGNGPVRRAYPAERWQPGEYIQDPQEVSLPDNWRSDAVKLYVGFWNGPHRLHVTKGEHDGEHRVLGLELPVGKAAVPSDLPSLTAQALEGKLQLDGKLDEDAWQKAPVTSALVHTMTGQPAEPGAVVRVLYDAAHVYFAFDVRDKDLRSSFEKHDDHLWEQDAVEIMLDPEGDGRNYFEVQVSPRGTVFETRYDTRRKPQPFGHVGWDAHADVGVAARGKVDDDDPDEGYSVEIALPWKAFSSEAEAIQPPKDGEQWRVNFYVMDSFKQGEKLQQRAVGWSPPKVGDFHVPQRFGQLQFGEAAEPETPAEPEASAEPAPAKAATQPAASAKPAAPAGEAAAAAKARSAAKASSAAKQEGEVAPAAAAQPSKTEGP